MADRIEAGAGGAFSRRLVFSLLAMLGLFVAAFAGTLLWLAREHDALAAHNARLLIEQGVNGRADALDSLAIDYSYWDEAAIHVPRRDVGWLRANMVPSADALAFDLLVFVYPDGGEIGWRIDAGGGPREGVLPAAVRDRLVSSRREAFGLLSARRDVVRLDGETWQMTVTHVAPQTRALTQAQAREAPIAIFGRRLDPEAVATIGDEVFIADVALAADAPRDPSLDALALRDAAGAPVSHLTWPRPTPGTTILRQVAVPIALILLGLVAVALGIGRHVMRSARRLERAVEGACAADRAKSEFLTTISHELRTPMNGVIGVAQLLEDTPLDEEQSELVAILGASAASQMKLIEELRSFGEIEAGALRLREEAVEPAALLHEATGAARVAAAGKGLALRVWVPEDAPVLLADPKRLAQVVINLAGNAVKFTDQGHVEVAATFEPRGEGEVLMRLAVSDTGPGIAPDQHARVFERFAQGDGSTRRRKGGTGLGLSISRAIARAMGGEIALRSAPGEGSTFTLVVPMRVIPAAAGTAPDVALEAAA